MCACDAGACGGQKREQDLLELELVRGGAGVRGGAEVRGGAVGHLTGCVNLNLVSL